MPAAEIVEPLNIVEHIGPCGIACLIDFARRPLGLQRREEALHRRVIPDVAGARQAALDALFRHQVLALLARVLRAVIGVMQ